MLALFFVYVLRSEKRDRYYIGSTQDVAQRLAQHNAGMMKGTRGLRPWRLVHAEAWETRAQARQREGQIKSWKNRAYLEKTLGL